MQLQEGIRVRYRGPFGRLDVRAQEENEDGGEDDQAEDEPAGPIAPGAVSEVSGWEAVAGCRRETHLPLQFPFKSQLRAIGCQCLLACRGGWGWKR